MINYNNKLFYSILDFVCVFSASSLALLSHLLKLTIKKTKTVKNILHFQH